MDYVSRKEWGARPWSRAVNTVKMAERTRTLIHWHGGAPQYQRGLQVPRTLEAIHMHDDPQHGWAGIGYNWVIDLDGVVYEGRGWGIVGAHCPGHNRDGIGIYIACGGTVRPTDAAINAARDVYDEACRLAGKPLRMSWHGEDYGTECPGGPLTDWVRRDKMARPAAAIGLPIKTAPHAAPDAPTLGRYLIYTKGSPMMRGADVDAVLRVVGLLKANESGGLYGPKSADAVKRWQLAHGLAGDGVVGSRTGAKMGFTWGGIK